MGGKNTKALVSLTLILLTLSVAKGTINHNTNLESLYPAYRLIKDIINGDPKSMFKLNQAFLPAMNYRYWQVDGVEIIPIYIHVSVYDDVQEQASLTCNATEEELQVHYSPVHWAFMWTNSLLMSLIPGDILLAMDDVIMMILYSDLVRSYYFRNIDLNFQINKSSLLCNFSLDDLQQASALFLSKSKVDIQPERDPNYQGYVFLRYTYYHYESYFSKLVIGRTHITNILIGLWITFGILNLSLPILSITRRRQILQCSKTVGATTNVQLLRAIILCVIGYNVLYILCMLVIHIKGYPQVLACYLRSTATHHSCEIPHSSTAYNYVLGIVITKLAILPFAILTELTIAIYIAKRSSTLKGCRLFMWAFVIWQMLIFVQITVGLVSIPLLLLIFISPARILLATGGMMLIFILITFALSTVPLPSSCNFAFWLKGILKSACSIIEAFVIALLIAFVFTTYFFIVKDGMNMSGVKGYIISFIPTVPISIFIWFVKKKYYLRERLQKTSRPRELVRERNDLATEEEMTGLLSTPSSEPN